MKTLLKTLLAALLVSACGVISPLSDAPPLQLTDHPLAGTIVGSTGGRRDEAAVTAALRRADVAILGETHDNPVHREIQAKMLADLVAAGRRPAVVFEQIDRTSQSELTQAQRKGSTDERVEAIGASFAKGWDWPAYRPLVQIAVEAGLPVFGGNVDRAALRPLVKDGWDTILPGIRQHLAIDAAWNEARDTYLTKVIEETHCDAIDDTLRDGLVRAQRLRDATLADAVLAARGFEKRPVVLITGRGHARNDAGVPRYLETREPSLKVVSLGITEVEANETKAGAYLQERADGPAHDFVWFTPRFDRPDPCAVFAKHKKPA